MKEEKLRMCPVDEPPPPPPPPPPPTPIEDDGQ
jgi:hypothetical protein